MIIAITGKKRPGKRLCMAGSTETGKKKQKLKTGNGTTAQCSRMGGMADIDPSSKCVVYQRKHT
jgi:hypothetical protein